MVWHRVVCAFGSALFWLLGDAKVPLGLVGHNDDRAIGSSWHRQVRTDCQSSRLQYTSAGPRELQVTTRQAVGQNRLAHSSCLWWPESSRGVCVIRRKQKLVEDEPVLTHPDVYDMRASVGNDKGCRCS